MPAHRTPWLIFLAQLAKETSSKKLAAAAAASLCLSGLQAAAPNHPLRCSCQGDVRGFGIKPFISGFTFLRQPVPTPQEPDHKGFKRNGHLKEERKKKEHSPSLRCPCLLSTARQQLPLPQNSRCLIPGYQFLPGAGESSTCEAQRATQQLSQLLALLIRPSPEMETERGRFCLSPSISPRRWFPSNPQLQTHKY